MSDPMEVDTESQEADGPITRSDLFHLSHKEQELFNFLMQIVKEFDLKVVLRVAGGWVRDKIMFSQSDDIDIALDTMMGKDFANCVTKYLIAHGLETHHVGVIQTNPDQSKHLETATTRVLGISLDFVNLRSEKYTEDSRIPEMDIGTPWQDAHRRDLTINALFYNINTGEVEDWTRRGLEDLNLRVIRTPLPPFQTFMDDPLRVLRTVRFACRLGFHIQPEIYEAGSHTNVRDMLAHKISRERICKELLGMLKGDRPALAIHYLHQMGLFESIFQLSETTVGNVHDFASIGTFSVRQAQRLLRSVDPIPADSKRIFLLASILYPTKGHIWITKKKKEDPLSNYMMLESLKMTTEDTVHVDMLFQTSSEFREVLQDFATSNGNNFSLRRVGLLLRRAKYLWLESLYLSILHDLPNFDNPIDPDVIDANFEAHNLPYWLLQAEQLRQRIFNAGLVGVWNMKPLVDGKTLLQLLQIPQGPILTKITQEVIEWQLDNPAGVAAQCEAFLLANKDRYHAEAATMKSTKKK